MPTSKLRSALIALALIVVAGLANLGLSLALEPYGTITELIWSQYRALEQGEIDTLCLGSSYAHRSFDPAAIDSTLGSESFNFATPAQSLSCSYDAIEHARSKMKDVVLIDTAGRMQTNNNLIAEMKKIVKVAKPDLKIFVGDSLAGNDAVEQAKVFDEAVGIDAIILTKIDTDAKGGAALSIAKTIGKPIAFVCDGQEYEDIEKFDADWMLERLFDQVTA